VDNELRYVAVEALRALGQSRDYRDRADAGRGLASLAEMQMAVGPLLDLVLDPDDTFVTRATAAALLRRKDRVGLAIVASALAVADSNHDEWIYSAVVDVFGIFASDRDNAVHLADEMVQDSDDRLSQGARQLLDILAGLDPVLHPA
jgi:hypothetical protein